MTRLSVDMVSSDTVTASVTRLSVDMVSSDMAANRHGEFRHTVTASVTQLSLDMVSLDMAVNRHGEFRHAITASVTQLSIDKMTFRSLLYAFLGSFSALNNEPIQRAGNKMTPGNCVNVSVSPRAQIPSNYHSIT